MTVRYTTKITDQHGNEHVKTRTSAGHAQPQYTVAFWAELREGGWRCYGFSSDPARAEYEAGRLSKAWPGRATAVAPVKAEVLASKR